MGGKTECYDKEIESSSWVSQSEDKEGDEKTRKETERWVGRQVNGKGQEMFNR